MKTGIAITAVFVLLSTGVASAAAEGTADFPQQFIKAQEAYDAGNLTGSLSIYGSMISNGCHNVEVYYNLANACFKNGDLPEAVLNYRRAWYQQPRDPDINANLRFALNAAGAVPPVTNLFERASAVRSMKEWIEAAIAAYLIGILSVILALLIRPAKSVLLKTSLIPGAAMLISLGCLWPWMQLETYPEFVVVRSGATALFGPVEGSTAHYKIPPGAIVRQRDIDSKGWMEIEYDGKTGWIKRDLISRVSP
ncbi:MAG: hypothetical protein K9M45_03770 [Kiritimatiellales bacterium]|nr:hypothetical protein [Kiritimatiellales bacterium]